MERGFVCVDIESARAVATAFTVGQEEFVDTIETSDNCGSVTGEVIPLKAVSNLYSRQSGFGVRIIESRYMGKMVFYFRVEYAI
jgi:hypothetical protein